jgi:hypothetical protein
MITADNATVEPTDTSMPPRIIVSIMGNTRKLLSKKTEGVSIRFSRERKYGDKEVSTTITSMSRIPSTVSHWKILSFKL